MKASLGCGNPTALAELKPGEVESIPLPGNSVEVIISNCVINLSPDKDCVFPGGLYYRGAGIGVAFIVPWVAPATNILGLVYTGSILGCGIVISRVAAALVMAFAVGAVMTAVFRSRARAQDPPSLRRFAVQSSRASV